MPVIVHVLPTRRAMGEATTARAADALREVLARGAFAAAPSQAEMLDAVAAQDVDWRRGRAFHMDEYVGLPSDSVGA